MEKALNADKQLKLKALSLTRSVQNILTDLTVELPTPGVTVLLGANGAGKSSLLKVLAGIIEPSTGEIEVGGLKTFAYMPEPANFYPNLTVCEQLEFVSTLYNGNNERVKQAIDTWQLGNQVNKLTKHLSLGYRQRLSLAQLSVADADLLLMDEPMNGMDPVVMQTFKQQIKQWCQTKAVIMATHIMHEAQAMADWVAIMHQGRIIHTTEYNNQNLNELYQTAINSHHDSVKQSASSNVI